MKRTLLFFFFATAATAQTPIAALYGTLATGTVEGTNHRIYVGVTTASAPDQTAGGANLTWDFTNLSAITADTYSNAAPDFGESTEYPGTTMVTTQNIGGNISKAYFNNTSATSYTGADTNGFQLNYSTDNATVGTFPLNYGYSATDPMGGTYTYQIYNGNFSGSITSSVDAYGTLNMNDIGFGAQSYAVTRLKMVQDFTISYSIFANAGTVNMTTYAYYRATDMFPVFSSTTTHIVVPLLAMDDTYETYEAAVPGILASPSFSGDALAFWPNPVRDVLHVSAPDVQAIQVIDMSGRTVASSAGAAVDVSGLAAGTYIARAITAHGSLTRQIVRQ